MPQRISYAEDAYDFYMKIGEYRPACTILVQRLAPASDKGQYDLSRLEQRTEKMLRLLADEPGEEWLAIRSLAETLDLLSRLRSSDVLPQTNIATKTLPDFTAKRDLFEDSKRNNEMNDRGRRRQVYERLHPVVSEIEEAFYSNNYALLDVLDVELAHLGDKSLSTRLPTLAQTQSNGRRVPTQAERSRNAVMLQA